MTEIRALAGSKNSSEESLMNGQIYEYEYEYYELDISFEGLKANKYSIVIAFWVGLAVFMIFLFIILMLMSRSGSSPAQTDNLQKKSTKKVKRNDGHQVQDENVSSCVASSLMPVDIGAVASVNLNNEQNSLEVSEGPQSLLDNIIISTRVIP
ncbi:melanocortin-2 receptor accessory protein 2-like [Chiloscyllium plagiosum]|uniref:melanocortin-2 receptor accessory protein 2-like n=1 Tax=Chiloscyllium plagiosum TaxID=36176 RepID=UPI001CB880C3|nr:melanocortin-2 receptor accessory protein 2-like [Chiloscyllium plagiosum]